MMKKIAQRIYRFSLSMKDSNYDEVRGIIENLIGQGALSRVVRDGIRLINDLSAGRTDVLLELYPWITEAICPPPNTDVDELNDRLARMERLLQQRPMQSSDLPDTREYGIPAMKSTAPVAAVVAAKAVSASTISDNFLSSMGF